VTSIWFFLSTLIRNRPFGRRRHTQHDNIKTDRKELGTKVRGGFAQDRNQWPIILKTIKRKMRHFLNISSNRAWLVKQESDLWK